MNRQLFLQLLEHPDSVSEQESIALKKFTEDFPYCQAGQLLFVKYLHSQKSVHYPEQLKTAAAYAADRKVLYNLIHAPAKEVEVVEAQIHHPESVALIEEHIKEGPASTEQEIIPEEKVVEETPSQIEIIQKRLQEIASEKTVPAVTEAEQEKKEELKSVSLPAKEETLPPPEIVTPVKPEKKKEEDLKSVKHSFTGWLKTVKKEPAVKPLPEDPEENTLPASTSDEIITLFIETEPRIVPSKAEFYNPVKMAKQSLEEREDIVSETLAGIFAEQGNLPRAIEMYRKLMLSNPEKSSFFAALIEKLTRQLNEEK